MSTLATVGVLILLAFLFPELGKKGGILRSEYWTQIGVFIIFLGMGLSLKRERWIEGLRSRSFILHLMIFQFLISPLIGWGVVLLFPSLDPRMKFAFFFLTALPTTISSASVFTQKSGENPALSAIASVSSNCTAVFLTPFWISIYLSEKSIGVISYRELLTPIVGSLIIPTVIGFIGRGVIGSFFEKYSGEISTLNMGIVFFILYTAFCDVFAMEVVTNCDLPLDQLLILGLLTLTFLIFSHALLFWFGIKFHSHHPFSFLFSGAQKSIATGAPIALVIVAQSEAILSVPLSYGLILLPFVIYHPSQILLGTWILKMKARFLSYF